MKKDSRDIVDEFKIDEALGHVVNRAAIIIRKKLTILFRESGFHITPEEFAIMSRLWEEDGLLQSEIIEKTLKDKTRVTRLLGGLLEQSLVEKRVLEEDRRNFKIYLTDKGHKLKYELLPIVSGLMAAAASNISEEDLNITIHTLRTIFTNINSTFKEKDEK